MLPALSPRASWWPLGWNWTHLTPLCMSATALASPDIIIIIHRKVKFISFFTDMRLTRIFAGVRERGEVITGVDHSLQLLGNRPQLSGELGNTPPPYLRIDISHKRGGYRERESS